jgi:hypothetical protein
MLYGNDRPQMRLFFQKVWKKYRNNEPLEPLETLIAQVIANHPEYHTHVENPDDVDRDFTPEQGATNPFLHMGMHLALREQSMTDQPPGVRAAYIALTKRYGDDHAAEHQMMECLGDVLWNAQRAGTEPDPGRYLECLKKRAGL